MREIRCRQCGGAVRTRASLAVGGRTLVPLHDGCYSGYAARQPWYRKPGWPVNRWRSFLPFNAILVVPLLALHGVIGISAGKWPTIMLLLILANGWLLLARLVSFIGVERHLPPARSQVRG